MRSEDYRYIIEDITHIYIGARYTYEELLHVQGVPFKIKKLVNQYIPVQYRGVTVESHLYYMDTSGFDYETLTQLKASVRYSARRTAGAGDPYEVLTRKIQQFVSISEADKKAREVMIEELILSKLSLMTI